MKTFSFCHVLLISGGIIGLALLALPASAQEANKVQELQRVIDAQKRENVAQQKQLEAQQKQLDAQRQLLQDLQKQMESLVKDAEPKKEIVAAEKPPAKPPEEPDKPLSEAGATLSQDFRHDRVSPTGSNFTFVDPAITLKVPNTNTTIGLHGFAEFQVIHDTNGLDNNEFDTIDIPVDGSPSQTKFSVNPSRFAISSQTSTQVGRFNTMLSMDFNGELDSPEPRLRTAWGEWINDELDYSFLAGQAFATMLDLRAVPETLDFAGPTGAFARRQPLARFSKLFGRTVLAEVAAETPENVSYINADELTRWPDFVAAGTWLFGSKFDHLRLAGLLRDLRAEGPNGSKDSTLGWAIAGSGKLGLPFLGPRDSFKLAVQYGEGYGAQIKSGPDDAAFNLGSSELETIGVFSTYAGLQHWWANSVRSNLVYGYLDADNPGFIDGDELENTTYLAANLVWNPYKKITLGFEYLWGRRENKDGASGNNNRFLFSSRFDY